MQRPTDPAPTPLTDEQLRRFVCDGFLALDAGLPLAVHADIHARLRRSDEGESKLGNNVLARIPEMHAVLEAPNIVGAVTSLLGEGYLLHPHRATHTSVPVEDKTLEVALDADAPPMGRGSMAGSGWHQDAHSPLARNRYHVPRFLILFYFPHDTPLVQGPTRVDAGSYLFNFPVRQPASPVVPDWIPAGTVYLVHFDMVHAGFTNRSDETRFMIKFVMARTRKPARRAMTPWGPPERRHTRLEAPAAWDAIWHWLHGQRRNKPASMDLTARRAGLNADDQAARLAAIYDADCLSAEEVSRLAGALRERAGLARHERRLQTDAAGKVQPIDARGREISWNERAIVMEDETYALVQAGSDAVPALLPLLALDDPWLAINVCFALGEIGDERGLAPLTRCLHSPHQQVVRTALDALAVLGIAFNDALPQIYALLTESNPDWQDAQVMRGWTAQDQIRLNAVFALVNAVGLAGIDRAAVETALVAALDDPNGYVPDVACEGLRRLGRKRGVAAAFRHLQARRWDGTLAPGVRLY